MNSSQCGTDKEISFTISGTDRLVNAGQRISLLFGNGLKQLLLIFIYCPVFIIYGHPVLV